MLGIALLTPTYNAMRDRRPTRIAGFMTMPAANLAALPLPADPMNKRLSREVPSLLVLAQLAEDLLSPEQTVQEFAR